MERVLAVLLTLGIYSFALGQGTLEPTNDLVPTKPDDNGLLLKDDPNPFPPPMPVRTMAEWEEVQAVILTWTEVPEVLTEIVRHAVHECRVLIVTNNHNTVADLLVDAGIELDSIDFIEHLFDDIWIRDYGPWTVYQNDVDSLNLIDWVYNRLRPFDDIIPEAIASYVDVPIYQAILPPYKLVHAGGNHLQDGMGTLFSSDLILDENIRLQEEEIDEIMTEFMGVTPGRYFKLPKLPFDVIHHLDMHMRLLDEETILIGEYPEGIADGPQIEDNIRYIKTQLQTPFGNPYRIVRVPMPPDSMGLYPDEGADYRTYTNALFVNKTILVPTYDMPYYDSLAIALYREELPGYNVVGIDCNPIISRVGAVHCITKLIGDQDPLWIAHPPIRDTYETSTDYVARVRTKHKSGLDQVMLYYRVFPESTYTAIEMIPETEHEDGWIALIPEQPVGSQVQYYIEVRANSGRTQVRPIVAPAGYFEFRILEEEAPQAKFLFDLKKTCPGGVVHFYDDSEGVVNSWAWEFPGAFPSLSNLPNPVVSYEEPGIYPVTLTVASEQGSSTITRESLIEVSGGVVPFLEDFADGIDPQWTIEDHQQDGITWEVFENGNCHDKCLYIDNRSVDTRNTNDYFRVKLDLSDFSGARLHFDVAYAPYDLQNHDALRVSVIRCNGVREAVFGKESFYLATAAPTTSLFVPSSCNQWRHETVDLCDFAGETITLEFEHISRYDDHGNALYLDNIEVVDACLVNTREPTTELMVEVWPNPVSDIMQIKFDDRILPAFTGQSDAHIVLFNENGQMVYHENVAEQQHEVPVNYLPSGAYFWVVQVGGAVAKSGKVIVE